MDTSDLQAAILEFPHPVRTCIVLDCPIEKLDLTNIDTDFEIVFLSRLQAEILVLPAAILNFDKYGFSHNSCVL